MSNTCAYIAGPMRGIFRYNWPAFFAAEIYLDSIGFACVNPARLDLEKGFDAYALPEDYDWANFPIGILMDIIKEDLDAVLECSHIYMLAGWDKSLGAQAEYAVAKWADKEVIWQQ